MIFVLQLVLIQAVQAANPISRPSERFEPTRDWVLEVDGHPVANSFVYYSEYDVAWLVKAPTIEPLMLSARTRSVRRVSEEVELGSDVSGESTTPVATVEPRDVKEAVADLTRDGTAYRFTLGQRVFRLVPAPPLLGPQTRLTVEARHPSVARGRGEYAASPHMHEAAVPEVGRSEAGVEETTVRVYFGSWSSACLRLVPRIAAVEEAWKGSGLRFEYYGLPQPLTDDEQAVADHVVGVPTVVVKRRGREIGRLSGRLLADPATNLSRILAGDGD